LLKNTKYGNLFTLNSPATSYSVDADGNDGNGDFDDGDGYNIGRCSHFLAVTV
jgi:hypothetical protein